MRTTPSGSPQLVAVPQDELDSLLAVRRWFHEGRAAAKLTFDPGLQDGANLRALKDRLVAEALEVLSPSR